MNRSGKILLNGQKYGGAQLFELTPPAEHHHIVGPLVTDSDNNTLATGSADIVLSNGIATINFAIEFEQDATYEDNFWGLNTNCFNGLNIPSITPTKGGFWDTYNYTDLMKLSPTFDIWNEEVGYSNNDIWTPSRYKWEYPLPTFDELLYEKTGNSVSTAAKNTILTDWSSRQTWTLLYTYNSAGPLYRLWLINNYADAGSTITCNGAIAYNLSGSVNATITERIVDTALTFLNKSNYQSFIRVGIYDDIAESGGGSTEPTIVLEKLPSTTFSVGTHLHGICYGTYNLSEINRGRIVNGDNIMY